MCPLVIQFVGWTEDALDAELATSEAQMHLEGLLVAAP